MPKPKILLIEDNAQNRILATFLLEDAGMEVISAVTGAEGLEKARSLRPDLILLDIQLPDIDGYELLVQLKKQPDVSRVPIVAVTSYAMAGERKRAQDLGCAGYVEKPIDTVNFAKQISEYLEKRDKGLRILIVEDDAASALVLRENLEHEGYEVVHAVNGREAMRQMNTEKFDLVITDLLMPEMDGYQLTHALKTDDRFKAIPVLIYTATYTDARDKALALDLGATDFIVKPTESGPFMRLIAEVAAKAAKGELPVRSAPQADEASYLRQYSERLIQKLESKVLETEDAKRKLERANNELESRVAQATADLRATIDQLNTANQELESFAYSVAHDLRAPLRTVRGLVTILRETHGSALSADAQAVCNRLIHNSDLMDRLITDLLNYSRLGTSSFALAPVSLDEVVSQTVEMLGGLIGQTHAQIEVQPGLPGVLGHAPTLIQIISNLLANAINFVAPGVQPHVQISTGQKAGRVRFRVRDNGIGIAPEFQQRIFLVFERLHDPDTYPGTGVGLAVVKKGIEKMGGTCGVESQAGQGSCFWIELAAAPQPDFERRRREDAAVAVHA